MLDVYFPVSYGKANISTGFRFLPPLYDTTSFLSHEAYYQFTELAPIALFYRHLCDSFRGNTCN